MVNPPLSPYEGLNGGNPKKGWLREETPVKVDDSGVPLFRKPTDLEIIKMPPFCAPIFAPATASHPEAGPPNLQTCQRQTTIYIQYLQWYSWYTYTQ